ncbi:MAG: twin-arginine translocation signal domain-containing protein, partial [Chloroflexi bacterium]|nr:twin-arginine translocation signal domain-containing protein [Chloroflexota bacterium]
MGSNAHTRRDFLKMASLGSAGALMAACTAQPEVVEKIVQETVIVEKVVEKVVTATPAAEQQESAGEPTSEPTSEPTPEPMARFTESPMLAERVAAGDLPPVEERLPDEPRICEIIGEIGSYGGTLVVGDTSTNLRGPDCASAQDRPYWLRPSHDLTHAVPNTMADWEMSADFTEVTCYLRKGMRWSDGEPVTTEDIRFWYEDILKNTELTPLPNIAFRRGGDLMTLDILDDYAFKLTFAAPNPSFVLVNMAHYGVGESGCWVPAHYMKQFHIQYNDKANDLAKAAGFDFWYQNFGKVNNVDQSLDRPRVHAFVPIKDTPQTVTFERNPYYHAVDPEGQQLPYIDTMVVERAAELGMFDAKVVGGTYDFSAFSLTIQNYTTYAAAAEDNNCRIIIWPTGRGSDQVYNLNFTWPDEEWRTVFRDLRFRQALSLALDRQDINDVVYYGNSFNRQYTVIPTSRHFRPEYETAYAEMDVERANALLDEMGLEWNSAKTHRLWPVSKTPIIIPFDTVELATPVMPIHELVNEHWQRIGIETQVKSITRNLLSQKILANEEPLSLWRGDESSDILFL